MSEFLEVVASWPSLLLVVVVFGFVPGFCLRLIILAYPRSDPRRAELIAELYAVSRIQRPLWVAEQLEVALFEGLPHRVSAATCQLTRWRLTFWAGGSVGLVVGAVMIFMIAAAPQPAAPQVTVLESSDGSDGLVSKVVDGLAPLLNDVP